MATIFTKTSTNTLILISFFCTILSAQVLQSKTLSLRGIIYKEADGIFIKDQNFISTVKLNFTNEITQKQIARLNTGDFAALSVTIPNEINQNTQTRSQDSAQPLNSVEPPQKQSGDNLNFISPFKFDITSAEVKSVDYVGLANLKGTWVSKQTQQCYEFLGFTTFYVYTKPSRAKCLRAPYLGALSTLSAKKYTYFINPDIAHWSLLISSINGEEYVGELQFKSNKEVNIRLFGIENAAILGIIQLRR